MPRYNDIEEKVYYQALMHNSLEDVYEKAIDYYFEHGEYFRDEVTGKDVVIDTGSSVLVVYYGGTKLNIDVVLSLWRKSKGQAPVGYVMVDI